MAAVSFALWEKVCRIAESLPYAYEKMVFGTPAFYIGKNLFVRLKEDGESIVLYTAGRDELMAASPELFFITDHYNNYPNHVLADLRAISTKQLKELLQISYALRSVKKKVSKTKKT